MSIIIEFVAQVVSAIFFNKLSQRIPISAKVWFNRLIYYFTSIMMGIAMGSLSLIVFPKPLISNFSLQVGNLFVAPILIGLILQNWRKRALGTKESHLDTFWCGFIFSFFWLLLRFVAVQNFDSAATSSIR